MELKEEILKWCLSAGISDITSNQPRCDVKIAGSPKPVKTALESNPYKEQIRQVKTLEDLRTMMAGFTLSPLRLTAQNLVFGDGNPKSKIMLIGEAPGADEDRLGKPFVGLSGKLLDKMLFAIGLNRSNVYISNIVPWRPPGNRTPTNDEIALFMPFVQRHIELVKPEIIVCVGGTAAKAILDKPEGVTRIRGQWLDFQITQSGFSAKAMVLFHPAYLLRSPGQKGVAWSDLLKIKQRMEEMHDA